MGRTCPAVFRPCEQRLASLRSAETCRNTKQKNCVTVDLLRTELREQSRPGGSRRSTSERPCARFTASCEGFLAVLELRPGARFWELAAPADSDRTHGHGTSASLARAAPGSMGRHSYRTISSGPPHGHQPTIYRPSSAISAGEPSPTAKRADGGDTYEQKISPATMHTAVAEKDRRRRWVSSTR